MSIGKSKAIKELVSWYFFSSTKVEFDTEKHGLILKDPNTTSETLKALDRGGMGINDHQSRSRNLEREFSELFDYLDPNTRKRLAKLSEAGMDSTGREYN